MNELVVKIEPKWVRKRDALKIFSIGHRKLALWSGQGFIRTIKFDDGQRGMRLYCAADIDDALLKMSAGYKLVPKIGRVKP